MKRPEKIDDRIISMARSLKITRPGFSLGCDAEEAYQHIAAQYVAEVESRCRECDLNEFAKERIWEMAQAMSSPGGRFGVLLCGTVGNGKTTLMNAACSAALMLQRMGKIDHAAIGYQYKSDFGFVRANAKELARYAKSDARAYDSAAKAPLLALDELGEEPKEVVEYGNVVNPIIDLLEHRYSKRLYTLCASNYGPKQIGEKYGKRIADRLREMMAVLSFGNYPSYR